MMFLYQTQLLPPLPPPQQMIPSVQGVGEQADADIYGAEDDGDTYGEADDYGAADDTYGDVDDGVYGD
jgi:hypothetical protein